MKVRGQLSIFFSLLLITILSLFLILIESARVTGARFRMEMAVNSSMKSMFAGYDKGLFDRYHLLFLNIPEAEMKSEIEDYLSYYNTPGKGILLTGGGFYPMDTHQVNLNHQITMMDQGGAYFEVSALDALGYSSIEGAVDQLSQWMGIMNKGEEANLILRSEEEAVKEYISQEAGEGLEVNYLDILAGWRGESIVERVLPKGSDISSKTIERNGLPSKDFVYETDEANDLLKNLGLNGYIQKYFSSFIDEKSGKRESDRLKYEQEYILCGMEQDKDNLNAVLGRILTLREGLNLVSLLNNQDKKGKAEVLSAIMAALVGIPEIQKVLEILILGYWAHCEAVEDMKVLLQGGKTPFLKSSSQWGTKLEDFFPELLSDENTDQKTGALDDNKFGELGYKDYLSIFLFIQDRREKRYRSMDVIQLNMQAEYNGFAIEKCIYELQIQVALRDFRGRENQILWTRNYK